jgi:uncharacterized protein (TIGR02246 family)
MKFRVFAMLIIAALCGFFAPALATGKAPAPLSGADESVVKALVNAFADSWNRHDMKAMHDLDTDDVDWINVVGHHWRGKETVTRGHIAIHKGMSATTTMNVEAATARAIAPDVAIVVATMRFSATQDPRYPWAKPSTTKTRGSFTAVKRDGVWKFVHFQNTIIDPNAENVDVPSFDATGIPPPGGP